MALNEGSSSDGSDVVFDDYRDDWIKSAERENKGEGSGSEFHQVKQWRKFPCSSRNKQALIVFATKDWQKDTYADNYQGRHMWSPVAEKPTSCHPEWFQERLTDLDSPQEEADTRLLLHAAHVARSKYVSVIIASEDTGVLVPSLAFKGFIPSSMFIKGSSQTRVKYWKF